jgi:iron complex transport system permease protein
MDRRSGRPQFTAFSPAVSGVLIACLCLAVFGALVLFRPRLPPSEASLDAVLLWNSLLPRAVIALLAGGALGLSGMLFQRVLRNPIADASTLGIASGAQLALTAAMSFTSLLSGMSREMVAFAGGLSAVALVLGLSWRRGFDPVTVVLSGMIVTLIASATSVTIVLARGEYAMSIYIWGAGALNQQDWSAVVALFPRLAAGLCAAALLLRPLQILSLDDSGARSLGAALHSTRLAVLALGVWLSASVTALVGVIGFVGLAAPALARLLGARTTGQLMIASPLTGAALLFLTDALSQIIGPGFSDLAPAGAATALLGGPFLLFLLPRIPSSVATTARALSEARRKRPAGTIALMLTTLLVLLLAALTIGLGPDGWHLDFGQTFLDVLPYRLPRAVTAGGAGALLAVAGLIMQRVTGNPIAGPEVLGVSAGGGAGLTVALFLTSFPSPGVMVVAMSLGALAALLVLMTISARAHFAPERMLLAGVAIGAFSMAGVTTVLAQGDMRGYILLTWLSGSTNRAGPLEAWTAVVALFALAAPVLLLGRWLAILPLGKTSAGSLGLPVARTRLLLATIASVMTAIATFLVGPLTLTGLIAPHLARTLGFWKQRDQLVASMLIGATVLMTADWLSRIVIFPYQVPVGIFATLIGGPYLVCLLTRKSASH